MRDIKYRSEPPAKGSREGEFVGRTEGPIPTTGAVIRFLCRETAMSENTGTNGDADTDETIRVWMVERGYTNRDLITLVYATPDGERAMHNERAAATMGGGSGVSAARDIDPERLEPVEEEETIERYRQEAERTSENYEPNETI
jgi:hypothetical protein